MDLLELKNRVHELFGEEYKHCCVMGNNRNKTRSVYKYAVLYKCNMVECTSELMAYKILFTLWQLIHEKPIRFTKALGKAYSLYKPGDDLLNKMCYKINKYTHPDRLMDKNKKLTVD